MVTAGLAEPGRAQQGHLPQGRPLQGAQGRERPNGLPRRRGQEGAAGQAQADRRRHRPRRLQGRHHDRQEGPGRRRRRGQGPDARGCRGKDLHVGLTSHQARRRGGRRDVRRRGLPEDAVQRRHPGQDAGRLDLQDLHADRGPAGPPISTKTKFDGSSPQYFKEFEDSTCHGRLPASGRVENFGRRAVRAASTCARRPATRSTPSSRSSTSRSARRRPRRPRSRPACRQRA